MNIRSFSCGAVLAVMLSIFFLPAAAQQKRTRSVKETEQEQIQRTLWKLEDEYKALKRRSDYIDKHEKELKDYAEDHLKAGDPQASAAQYRLAAEVVPFLEKIVGKLDAKFDKAGFLLDSEKTAIRYLTKLKAHRLALLDRQEFLLKQQVLLTKLQNQQKK